MGECCNGGSRIILHKSIADDFTKKIVALSKKVKVGDPLDPTVKVGAIISDKHANKIYSYFDSALEEGAKVELGGNKSNDDNGCFIQPTIYSGVTADMKIAKEEIFGPVLSVLTFETEAEALEIANSTSFGLSASVWTKDIDRAMRLSRSIEAGTVWINTYMSGYAELPFGGYKESGLGREMGTAAIDEFTELKTIQVHIGERTGWWTK
jgi:acyl-CoA reductase-like NAD-dependent aldehyde dehydrogenase